VIIVYMDLASINILLDKISFMCKIYIIIFNVDA
jgi:hypothetical protein